MLSLIETVIPIVVGMSGGALLILGIIYEDVLITTEDRIKEHIKKKVRMWIRRTREALNGR